jgi:hypothetical protein
MTIADCIKKHQKNLFAVAIAVPLLTTLVLSAPVRAAPSVTITPNSGAIGTGIVINGSVFDSYKGDRIYIFFDDEETPNSPVVVDDDGTFSTTFTIPADTDPGTYYIEARSDKTSTSMLARNFFIVEEPEIALDLVDGPVGTEVTVNGWGFYSGRTVTFYYYNKISEKLGTELASDIGEFSYEFTVPYSTAGEHRITASNAEGNEVDTEFEVIPQVDLNLSSAGPGDLVTIRGTGFGYRTQVDVDFGIYQVATVRTDEYGNFDVVFNVPEVKPGSYDVKALDDVGNLDKTQLTATAGARLNQNQGPVGAIITVSGSGFQPEGVVTVEFDNVRVTAASTDNNGAFSTGFSVPAGSSGSHVIVVSDGQTSRQLNFTVEADAPPVPELELPADDSETRAEAYLDWQDVTDPSLPVTYYLQIASDNNFSSVVVEKESLTDSEYKLTKSEYLAAISDVTPYYWRVKAGDGAGNTSEWSAPRSFYVSAPSVPVPSLPVSGSQAQKPLFFNWQSVSSLSTPVTYRLQVATDLNFMSIVLEEAGLTDSEFVLSSEDDLPDVKPETPYYWRVKTVDSAFNESEWSAVQSFYTGSSFSLPSWLIYLLIAVAVIAVGYLAFRVGRQTAFRQAG